MPGSQVKDWDTYHTLRTKGKSKSQAARIANAIASERKRRRVAKGSPDVGDVHVASVPQPTRRRRRRKRPQDILSDAMLTKHGDHDQSSHGNWARGTATKPDPKARQQQFEEDKGNQGGLFDATPAEISSRFRIDNVFPDQLQPNDVIIGGKRMRGHSETPFRYRETVRLEADTGDRWILGDEPEQANVMRVVNDSGSTLSVIRLPRSLRGQYLRKHFGPGPHKSGTPQSIHGNWSRGTSAPEVLEDTEEEGGTTKELVTGKLPERGFAVALHELGQDIPIKSVTPRTIQTFIRTRYAQLTQPGRFLGTWLDKESGKVWLDVVQVFDNDDDYTMAFEQAVAFGKHEEELAIFDLADFEEIRLTPGDIRSYGDKLKAAA